MVSFRESFFRLKTTKNVMETRLKRCLTITDITLLGVGHMVGAGIYVLTGEYLFNSLSLLFIKICLFFEKKKKRDLHKFSQEFIIKNV